MRRSFGRMEIEGVADFFKKETAAVFVEENDIVKACKVMVDFSKDNEALVLKGGVLNNKIISSKEMAALASLPSRDVLLSMVLRGFTSPLTGFLTCMNQIILKFVWAVEEIKKVKSQNN